MKKISRSSSGLSCELIMSSYFYLILSEEEYEKSWLRIFKHCIDISYDRIPENDYDFFAVAFHGDDNETLYRQDADTFEINRIKNDVDGYGKIWREFKTDKKLCYISQRKRSPSWY